MTPEQQQQFVKALYEAFNRRDIETVIAQMQPDVEWANGTNGGHVHGHDAVRSYWRRQFQVIEPHMEVLHFDKDDEGRFIITVRQVVRDMGGQVLLEKTLGQRFAMKDGLIHRFDILELQPQGEL
ncbi:nuclear transport factor 2 family protein [bacterium]|nr:MAG: nuclear transport factor 2 family protein [bacterium]